MKNYRYVTLDPTGNLTCLVLDPADPSDEAALTRKLLEQCEQVAYLVPPDRPEAVAGIRLMGGEFCGNAAMAAAAWLVRDELAAGEEKALLLEVSGAADPVRCSVRKTDEGFEGTVDMPGAPEIGKETIFGIPFTVVRLEGIIHLISEGRTFEPDAAEALLRRIAGQLPDEAAGLIQWDREKQYMLPLVYVRGSESMTWEHGCGSGSAAIGALETLRSGEKTVPVNQPGGTICVTAEKEDGAVRAVSITGTVRIGAENSIQIP
ncbi:MAG: hypothetical protein K6F61_03175 [Clostridiales bacterium]|nr:hypothetical protein [Clostridiales bacterium]